MLSSIRATRAVVTMYISSYSQAFFKPSKAYAHRCKALGCTDRFPCIVSVPLLSDSVARLVARKLVALRHAFNANTRKAFDAGNLQLRGAHISYRGAVPEDWGADTHGAVAIRVTLEHLSRHIEHLSPSPEDFPAPPCPNQTNVFLLTCRKCGNARDASRIKLLDGTT